MVLRPIFIEHDFPILQEFWKKKGMPAVPKQYLPPTGAVVEIDEDILCGAFLVKSDANQASIGYIAANPEFPKEIRAEGLDILIQGLEQIAKASGYSMMTVCTNVPSLQLRYQERGYLLTDSHVKHFVKEV